MRSAPRPRHSRPLSKKAAPPAPSLVDDFLDHPFALPGLAAVLLLLAGYGFYISLAGIITFPKAAALREAIADVPLDRLLTETDSPFLAPVPHRGKRNEPAYLPRVVATLAELRGLAAADLAEQTTANFHALFRP